MHRLEAGVSQMRQTSRVVAIGLVGRKRLERLEGLSAPDADHRETELAQPVKQDRRHTLSLNTMRRQLGSFDNSPAIASAVNSRLALANHHAFAIENADVRLVDRDIQASKILP